MKPSPHGKELRIPLEGLSDPVAAQDSMSSFPKVTVEGVLFSALIATVAGFKVYSALTFQQSYPDFLVGYMAWRAESKASDYLFFLSILVIFGVVFYGYASLVGYASQRLGNDFEKRLGRAYRICLFPAAVYVSSLVLGQPSISLCYTAIVCGLVISILALVLAYRGVAHAGELLESGSVGVFLWLAGGEGFSIAIVRFLPQPRLAVWIAPAAFLVGLGFVLSRYLLDPAASAPSPNQRKGRERISGRAMRHLELMLGLVQIPVALIYFDLVGSAPVRPDPENPLRSLSAWALASCFVVLCCADVVRRQRRPADGNYFRRISPLSIAAVLLLFKINPYSGVIVADDYHFSEWLLPWWQTVKFGSIPFWDYTPARGLVNYLPGAAGALLFDGTAAATLAGNSIVSALYVVCGYVALTRYLGPLLAFTGMLLLPFPNGLSEIDLVMTVALAFLVIECPRWPSETALLAYSVVGFLLVLFAPAQGGIVMLATLPLAAIWVWRMIRTDRRRAARRVGAAITVALVMLLITPAGKMFVGAIRYTWEQSAINSVAHGIPLADGFAFTKRVNSVIWEGIRASFLLGGMLSLILSFRGRTRPKGTSNTDLRHLGMIVSLVLVLFVFRSAGRVEPASLSRLGILSTWVSALLIPLLLRELLGTSRTTLIAVGSAMLVSLVSPATADWDPEQVQRRALAGAPVVPAADSRLRALSNIGSAVFQDQAASARLATLDSICRSTLRSGETFLDLSNRPAIYFYLNRPMPAEAALYNLPNVEAQSRSIDRAAAMRVPLVIAPAADDEPGDGDGGKPSLRAYMLYRFVIENYSPFRVGNYIFLARPDRLAQIEAVGAVVPHDEAGRLELLDIAFATENFRMIPAAWGRSSKTLLQKTDSTHSIPMAPTETGNGEYVLHAAHPFRGLDSGLLVFDLDRPEGVPFGPCELSWNRDPGIEAGFSKPIQFTLDRGTAIIPLDTLPRWLFTGHIEYLHLLLRGVEPGTRIRNARMVQRLSVARVQRAALTLRGKELAKKN